MGDWGGIINMGLLTLCFDGRNHPHPLVYIVSSTAGPSQRSLDPVIGRGGFNVNYPRPPVWCVTKHSTPRRSADWVRFIAWGGKGKLSLLCMWSLATRLRPLRTKRVIRTYTRGFSTFRDVFRSKSGFRDTFFVLIKNRDCPGGIGTVNRSVMCLLSRA